MADEPTSDEVNLNDPEPKDPETPEETPEDKPEVIEPPLRGEPQKEKETPDKPAEEEEIDPDDEKTIAKIVDRKVSSRLDSIERQTQDQAISMELRSELDSHPEYKPYEARIRAFVNHPNRKGLIQKGLPVSTVILEAVAPYLQKIGAEKEREAQERANGTKDTGSTVRKQSSGAVDWHTASKEDFQAQRARVLGQQG